MKKLGFGFMRLPLLDKDDHSNIDLEQVKKMVDLFMERGFCYFDTAYPYHGQKSEEAIRKCLVERYPRESFLLADKMPTVRVTSPDDYPVLFDEQLKRCGVDFFDFYLFHNIWKKSYEDTVRFGGFEFMAEKVKEGKIKHLGFSFHDSPELLDRVLREQPRLEFVQLQINYLDWESPSVRARECLETARKYGKPVIIMEPNKGGSLINLPPEAEKLFREYNPSASNAEWAMRWAASQEGVAVVLSGMSSLSQLEENTAFMAGFKPVTPGENEIIKKAAKILSEKAAIGCTGCRYCTDGCPMGIPIPEYFDAYNSYILTKNMGNAGMYYRRCSNGKNPASACIECRSCEKSCPQHLKITGLLKTVAKCFEVKAD
ncbi:MAG: aldo/keto reductase [Clostridiales bacterium]|nr:aldo/keto reductase [Clostridiales bacterium]